MLWIAFSDTVNAPLSYVIKHCNLWFILYTRYGITPPYPSVVRRCLSIFFARQTRVSHGQSATIRGSSLGPWLPIPTICLVDFYTVCLQWRLLFFLRKRFFGFEVHSGPKAPPDNFLDPKSVRNSFSKIFVKNHRKAAQISRIMEWILVIFSSL